MGGHRVVHIAAQLLTIGKNLELVASFQANFPGRYTELRVSEIIDEAVFVS